MGASTILYLFSGFAAPFVGKLVDRYGARIVISIGAFVAGIGFVCLGLMRDLWHFYFGYAVIGAGMAAMGQTPTSAVISNWFRKRRGLSIGILSVGVGAGGFVITPLVGGYLIPKVGWRASYLALAVLIWGLIVPLALFVIKTKPADIGLYPYETDVAAAVATTQMSFKAPEGVTLKTALATSPFWLIAIAFLSSGISSVGIFQSQVPYFVDIGLPVSTGVAVLGGIGLASAAGKFGFGWLCDFIPAKYALCIGFALQTAGLIVLMFIRPALPPVLIWLYVILMGLGVGSWLPTMSMLTNTNFGLSSYGAIFGATHLVYSFGCASGPLIAGFMCDAMGTYRGAFLLFLVLYIVAMGAILLVSSPRYFNREEKLEAAGLRLKT